MQNFSLSSFTDVRRVREERTVSKSVATVGIVRNYTLREASAPHAFRTLCSSVGLGLFERFACVDTVDIVRVPFVSRWGLGCIRPGGSPGRRPTALALHLMDFSRGRLDVADIRHFWGRRFCAVVILLVFFGFIGLPLDLFLQTPHELVGLRRVLAASSNCRAVLVE